ncbi:putative odorant-binding protein A10 isoform X1 [Musca domestica]|uniref:Odorant-binding protein A10 isoform X1 n=1 Tax=Musca domestica TaxID=7370 RepID=A0A9J7CZA3_MUSDO|nr:putative odorant-binding protein A10 isoform X1 [Musca domestica]
MKSFILLVSVLSFLSFCSAVPHPPATTAAPMKGTYDSRFDNIDVDEILQQERLLMNYVKCLEGTGPCTPDGKALKETLPDAIATNCEKCTQKQKEGSDKVTHFLIDNRPEDWQRLEKIYDPEGTYRKAYLAEKETSTTTTSNANPEANK